MAAATRREGDEGHGSSVARARWGDKMIEFVGADSQHLIIILLLVLGVAIVVYDNRAVAKLGTEAQAANAKVFLEAHTATQALLKETLAALKKSNDDNFRQGVNMTYVLSLSPEERKNLRLEVPADFKPFYQNGRR